MLLLSADYSQLQPVINFNGLWKSPVPGVIRPDMYAMRYTFFMLVRGLAVRQANRD